MCLDSSRDPSSLHGHHSQYQRTVCTGSGQSHTPCGITADSLTGITTSVSFVSCKIDVQLSSVSRLNANVAVGDPVQITRLESAVHEASQISLAALHPVPFASNLMFTLFTKEIMGKCVNPALPQTPVENSNPYSYLDRISGNQICAKGQLHRVSVQRQTSEV